MNMLETLLILRSGEKLANRDGREHLICERNDVHSRGCHVLQQDALLLQVRGVSSADHELELAFKHVLPNELAGGGRACGKVGLHLVVVQANDGG